MNDFDSRLSKAERDLRLLKKWESLIQKNAIAIESNAKDVKQNAEGIKENREQIKKILILLSGNGDVGMAEKQRITDTRLKAVESWQAGVMGDSKKILMIVLTSALITILSILGGLTYLGFQKQVISQSEIKNVVKEVVKETINQKEKEK